MPTLERLLRLCAASALAMLVAGCAFWQDGVVFYLQSIGGHLQVIREARPITEMLDDERLDATLRTRLERVREIRAFASAELALPDNGSYTRYADLRRPYVLWNVVAAPELSLQLKTWCFPVAGCVSYRGYYDASEAERYAAMLRDEGLETSVAGVPAYSTLGWFDDPVLNTFIHYPEAELARLIFHELAHQVLYVKGDSMFNESFATAVEEAGVERWLARRNDPEIERLYREFSVRRGQFVAMLRRTRDELDELYRSDISDAEKRAGKAGIFAQLRRRYQDLKTEWNGYAGYDRWFGQGPTNAHLGAVATYNQWVPAFRALLAEQHGDLSRFFAAARVIAGGDAQQRRQALEALATRPATGRVDGTPNDLRAKLVQSP